MSHYRNDSFRVIDCQSCSVIENLRIYQRCGFKYKSTMEWCRTVMFLFISIVSQCGNMAREGLRVLVVAKKSLTEEQYQDFEVRFLVNHL